MTPIATSQPTAIREARVAAKLTQQNLAELARCSIAYIQMVEGGWAPGNPEASPTYKRLLDVLNEERRPDPAGAPEDGGTAPHVSG